MLREQVKLDTDDRLYMMFDGPIDTLWIESLNTVLDDNRTLCLPNGERIKLNGRSLPFASFVMLLAYSSVF